MACAITWLQKGNPEIARLAALAEKQQGELLSAKPLGGPVEGLRSKLPIFPFDTMITPWQSKFGNDPDWHFVAQAPDGRICGWLTAQLKETDSRKYVYLAEISTRRIRDELYGGVGRRLHEALVTAARGENYDFIYLYPVSEKVAAVYEGWGYSRPIPGIPHQFYVLNQGPTGGILRSLMTQRPNVEALNRARAVFGQRFDEYRRAVLSESGNVDALNDLLTDFEVEEATIPELVERPRREKQRAEIAAAEVARLENQRARMGELLESMKKGGRRRTRRMRRTRSTRDLGARKTRRSPIKKRAYT